ncbi:HAMP domain-containing protein [Duganella sp. FT135W]|uniref:HAMP domain-containing protein n=1 Tax=Duganella flavida TaxID=2692175 RepID=A0A6L8K921_9BURK|nr:methyl-accepting chemotaxis protein [Duganella flavida]MYM23515.1 HAMP domain-containing protein [Duganella flavida]
MSLSNFKIGPRLSVAFAIILCMLVGVAIMGLSRMASMQQAMIEITKANDVEANLASDMKMSLDDRMIALRNIVLLEDRTQMQAQVERVAEQLKKYDEAEQKLSATFKEYGLQADETQLTGDIRDRAAAARPLMQKVQELGQANQNAEAIKLLMGELLPIQAGWSKSLAALVASERHQNEELTEAASANYAFARNMVIVITVVAVLFGIVLAQLITRSITVPINRAVEIAQTVAAGDLTSRIEVSGRDETSMLLGALKAMNDSLQAIVSQVRAGTDTMSTASQEIAAGNLDLSSRTEEQASSLEETASSMEELTSTVKQNADNARQADSLARTASEVASRGGLVIADVVHTMSAINDSSKKIVEIISVIDGIAFQTNILALNAAVEAARAGEQGRGFAVVASEVRNLAQRSAAAAKEIKTLISDSVSKVESGSQLVDQAGATMTDVVESVRRVSDIITEITAASREQSLGIEQINQAVIQMDGVTQQNAALVEQSAAAAESLQGQAAQLAGVVGKFVLDQQHALPPRARPAASAAPRLKMVTRAKAVAF